MNEINAITITSIATAIAVVAQHYTFGRWWRRNEIARRTMGHATILAALLALVFMGAVPLTAWLAVLIVTGVAGATLAALAVTEHEQKRDGYVELIKKQQNEQAE